QEGTRLGARHEENPDGLVAPEHWHPQTTPESEPPTRITGPGGQLRRRLEIVHLDHPPLADGAQARPLAVQAPRIVPADLRQDFRALAIGTDVMDQPVLHPQRGPMRAAAEAHRALGDGVED